MLLHAPCLQSVNSVLYQFSHGKTVLCCADNPASVWQQARGWREGTKGVISHRRLRERRGIRRSSGVVRNGKADATPLKKAILVITGIGACAGQSVGTTAAPGNAEQAGRSRGYQSRLCFGCNAEQAGRSRGYQSRLRMQRREERYPSPPPVKESDEVDSAHGGGAGCILFGGQLYSMHTRSRYYRTLSGQFWYHVLQGFKILMYTANSMSTTVCSFVLDVDCFLTGSLR